MFATMNININVNTKTAFVPPRQETDDILLPQPKGLKKSPATAAAAARPPTATTLVGSKEICPPIM